MKGYAALGLTLFALALASPVAAQQYPPEVRGEVAVSDSTLVCPGDSVTVTGTAWAPGEEVRILFDGTQIATVVPNAQGGFSVTVTTPEASLGLHTLTAIQEAPAEGQITAEASITCVAAAAEAAPGVGDGLADTGATIATWVAIAFGLLLAGGAILLAGRKRRASAES